MYHNRLLIQYNLIQLSLFSENQNIIRIEKKKCAFKLHFEYITYLTKFLNSFYSILKLLWVVVNYLKVKINKIVLI